MDFLKSFFRGNEDGEFYRRMFFVGVALNAVQYNLKKNYNEAETLINCLKIYFSATSELYLTIYEVRSVLYGTLVLLNQPDLFDIYSQEFDNLMPECPATLQPRKATHIARCQVRQNLKASNLPLPDAIEKLQLPRTVKEFLVCDVFEFPSRNGNTYAKKAVTKSELERLLFGRQSS